MRDSTTPDDRRDQPDAASRIAARERSFRAGCSVCHADRARWTSANAQALAAQHYDRTGHPTWCKIEVDVRYGYGAPDPRQTDIEDAIAASSSGGRPDAAPLTDPDAPAPVRAGVSAPKAAQSRRALAAAKPELVST